MIIDAHAHVFPFIAGAKNGRPIRSERFGDINMAGDVRPFLPPSFDSGASLPELLIAYMDRAGVERAVLLQHPMYGYFNSFVAEAVRTWRDRLKGLAVVDITDPPGALRQLDQARQDGLSGMKIECPSAMGHRPDLHLDDARLAPLWACCQDYRWPVVLHLFPGNAQVLELQRIADRFPDLRFVICHLGMAPQGGWLDQVALARDPRFVVDLAAIALGFPGEDYPYPSAMDCVERARDLVGAECLLWGSDYPGILRVMTYEQTVNLVVRHTPFLSDAERAWILGGNAARVFNWPADIDKEDSA